MAAAFPPNFDTAKIATHQDSLRLEVGPVVVSHCLNNLLPPTPDSAYFSIWECLLGRNYMECRFDTCMAAWILDYTRRTGDPATPSVFADAATIMNGVYGLNPARTAFSPLFLALVRSMQRVIPANVDVAALGQSIAAAPNPIPDAYLRNMDADFFGVLTASDAEWREIYRGFGHRLALSCMVGGIASLCHRGTMTGAHIAKIVQGTADIGRVGDVLTQESSAICYRILKALFPRDCRVSDLFERLEVLFPLETNLRLSLIINQARRAGVSAVSITMSAMRISEDCSVWAFLNHRAPQEVTAFVAAARAVAADPYIGFDLIGNIPEAIKSTRYPSVVSAGLTVLSALNPNDTTVRYGGRHNTPLQADITAIVARWVAARNVQAVDPRYEGQGDRAINIRGVINGNTNTWDQFA